MKIEETKRHIVEVIVNCPLINEFTNYGDRKSKGVEGVIKCIMSSFDIVETGFLQGDDKGIEYAIDIIDIEFVQGLEKVRGDRLIDVWKEACKKFKAHEVKRLARFIEKTIIKLNDVNVSTAMADKMKDTTPLSKEKEMENELNKYIEIIRAVHPDLAEDIVSMNSMASTPLTWQQINDLLLSVVKNQLNNEKTEAKAQQNKIDINEITSPESEEDKRLQDDISSENIVRGLDFPFTPDVKCNNPNCPVHGNKKVNLIQDLLKTKCPDGEELHEHQQRIVDLIIGIDPAQEGRIAFINPNLGETRSKGPYDFSGVLKFLEDHFYPEPKKPTITEIETSTNVVINQSFIVHDTKGEFFCEYKMTWTPSKVRFMFTHDKPNITGMGRRFYQISELTKPMTQDEAFKEFQSLRRVVIDNGAHNPRVISFAGN